MAARHDPCIPTGKIMIGKTMTSKTIESKDVPCCYLLNKQWIPLISINNNGVLSQSSTSQQNNRTDPPIRGPNSPIDSTSDRPTRSTKKTHSRKKIRPMPNYTVWCIFTILVNPVFGIMALIFSCLAQNKCAARQMVAAKLFNRLSLISCLGAIVFNTVVTVCLVIVKHTRPPPHVNLVTRHDIMYRKLFFSMVQPGERNSSFSPPLVNNTDEPSGSLLPDLNNDTSLEVPDLTPEGSSKRLAHLFDNRAVIKKLRKMMNDNVLILEGKTFGNLTSLRGMSQGTFMQQLDTMTKH